MIEQIRPLRPIIRLMKEKRATTQEQLRELVKGLWKPLGRCCPDQWH